MSTWLDGYLGKWKSEKVDAESNFIAMLIQRTDDVKRMIKERWLLGKRPNGDIIGFYRDVDYAIFKQTINPLADGDVDLTVTESLGNKIILIPDNSKVEIISEDWKYEEISLKYGIDNFNVTEKEEDDLLNDIAVSLIEAVFKKIW